METAIIGLPLAGKTTIFNALAGRREALSAFAGGRKQANLADIVVPDERVDRLSKHFTPRKTTYATVLFRDSSIALDGGISPDGQAELQRADVLACVVRAFHSEAVLPARAEVDPLGDFRAIEETLVLADLEAAEKRRERLEKEAKKGAEHAPLLRAIARLSEGKPLGKGFLSAEEEALFSGFSFLTAKPIVLAINTGESSADDSALRELCRQRGIACFSLRGDLEMEISQLDPADQAEFLRDIGVTEPARDRFLRYVYESLDLVSFFTTGEDEVKAWSIRRETPASRAAGKIHTDLERTFIRAEVIRWDELLALGGKAEAQKTGKMRLEGKEYIVQDGDVLVIRAGGIAASR